MIRSEVPTFSRRFCESGAALSGLFILATGLAFFPAHAGEHSMKCYSEGYDKDGDGYAGLNAEDARTAYKMFTWSGKGRVDCPDGYVRMVSDCNDRDPEMRPNHAEIGFNGHDDDCDGVIDEPTFALARSSTDSKFWLKIEINSQDVIDHTADLFAQVSYARLDDSENLHQTSNYLVHPAGQRHVVELAVTDLTPLTVYRAQVTFFTLDAQGAYEQVGPTMADVDWHYAVTNGRNTETCTRFTIIERGFQQLRESQMGLVGYRGTKSIDGTRYGADRNEMWCTEFYVWVTKLNLRRIADVEMWDDAIDYFRDADSLLPASDLDGGAVPADYVVMDSDGDGKKNHSGMFLAYESGKSRAWTLEGNSSNGVRVRTRRTEIRNIGHLTPELLKNTSNPPPPAVGIVMPDECKEIKTRIDSLEHDLERWQARLDHASPAGKDELMRRISEINDDIDEAKQEYRECLDEAKRQQP